MNHMHNEAHATSLHEAPSRLLDMQSAGSRSERIERPRRRPRLIAKAPDGFLDTTHFEHGAFSATGMGA